MKTFNKRVRIDPYELLNKLEDKQARQYKQIIYGAEGVDILDTEEKIRNLKEKIGIKQL